MTYGKTVKIMKILPHEVVTFRTALSINEITDRLNAMTEHRKPSSFTSPLKHHDRAYQGVIAHDGFTILRNIDYRNSFRPVIYGQLRAAAGYSEMRIEMKMHKFVRVFMSIWLAGVSIAAIGTAIAALQSSYFGFHLLAAPGMFLVGYFMCTIAFKKESDRVKQDFEQTLQAKIIENNP